MSTTRWCSAFHGAPRAWRQLLGWLSGQLPLPIPVPEFDGPPGDVYSCRFLGYRYLPGTVLSETDPDDERRTRMARPLAAFLSALHAVDVERASELGALPDPIARMDPALRGPRAIERLVHVRDLGALPDPTLVERIEALLADGPDRYPARSDTLVHGDLHSSQILVDDDFNLAAVVDWGDAHVGDRAADLSAVHGILPRAAHDAFLDAYGPVTDEEWAIARSRAVWLTAALLDHAVDTGQRRKAADALGTLDRIAGGPIG